MLPDDADAHALYGAGQARAGLRRRRRASSEIAPALQDRSPSTPARSALRAELRVDDEQLRRGAATRAQTVLAINPEDVARAHHRRRRRASCATTRRATRPSAIACSRPTRARASFFHGVAEFLVKEHRYVEANALEEEAIKRRPEGLGGAGGARLATCLRLGDDAEGRRGAAARRGSGDPYNVRTYNLLNLFEDVIPKEYTLVEGKPFRFRVAKQRADDRSSATCRPMVEREYAELVQALRLHAGGAAHHRAVHRPAALRGAHRRAAGARGARRHLRQGDHRACRRRWAASTGA